MPVVPQFNGSTVVYVIEEQTIETRSDALAAEVPRRQIDTRLVNDTERVVRMASRTLGLDPEPRLRWLPEDTRGLNGIVFCSTPSEVWVRVQDRDAARKSAVHEVRHVWQIRTGNERDELEDEWDAKQFAASWSPWDEPIQERGRRLWEERYAPIQQAARQHVYERQDLHSAGGRRSAIYAVKVIR